MRRLVAIFLLAFAALRSPASAADPQPLAGTKPLTMEGDIAAQLVAGVDTFLLRKIDESTEQRAKYWKRDFSSEEAYNKSVEPNRQRLAHMLGVRDARVKFDAPELIANTGGNALIGEGATYKIYAVRWPVLGFPGPGNEASVSIFAEGLLLLPNDAAIIVADVVAIPDADQTPEQISGLIADVPEESQFARILAGSGCRVLVPMLISREYKARNGRAKMTNREYVYRGAFELGRHLIGYEVQKVLAGVDWFEREAEQAKRDAKIGVIGYGEGGAIALYAAALDTRIDAACVSGYFDNRNQIWQQPLDRNIFGLLQQFGDAELASLVVSRGLVLHNGAGPKVQLPSEGGAPALLESPSAAKDEYKRFLSIVDRSELSTGISQIEDGADAVGEFLNRLADTAVQDQSGLHPREGFTGAARQQRQLEQLDRHNQSLLRESPYVRQEFMKNLDTTSLEKYNQTVEDYRRVYRNDVIGAFDDKPLPFNPRTRKAYDEEKWTGYEVVLDLWPDVICYGILCLPKDLKLDGSEQRPVVVCQHGLEGRPQDIVKGDHPAYHDFASKLCEQGFITFAPQNLYIGHDAFRTLQRKANPLGKTLFSVIVPQHQQIVDWMQTLPYVDGERIAFYGLSYGGKSAMRIPPLVSDYCLSICSADFNEWVDKNASTRGPYSYVWSPEYEIFEWDLGSTFNYAEMAALIAPRPFMVERGHFDGVGTDENVAYEFAKVRNLYAARLNLPDDKCQIEWFVGPHTINGKGTFEFLHHHLKWPKK